MTSRALLRTLAVLIAVAAFLDPAIDVDTPRRQRLTIAVADARAVPAGERLQRLAGDEFDATLRLVDTQSAAAACPAGGGCVFISRGTVPERLTAGATVVGALHVQEDPPRAIRRIEVPEVVHRDAAAVVRVSLRRAASRIDVFDGDIRVGSIEPSDARVVDVPWVPTGDGVRALRVEAEGDVAEAGVLVSRAPASVLMYEPEPTWLGTFVRRALEDDPRLALAGRTRVAPPVAVTRGGMEALTARAIAEAGTVIVPAPESLRAPEVDLLERFVTHRGGSLILVPDRPPSRNLTPWMPPVVREGRSVEPRRAGLLSVREWLAFAPDAGTMTLAAVGEDAVVVSRAFGRGRVIVSGALDAWRHRGETSEFATFWTSLAWEADAAAGEQLHVQLDRQLAEPGEPVRISVELQTMEPPPPHGAARASAACGSAARQVVRLWPDARPGAFKGEWRPDAVGTCEVAVTVDGLTATRQLVAKESVARPDIGDEGLEAAVATYGGVVVPADQAADLAARARVMMPAGNERRTVWPMRSPYWCLPFAACLAGEWWLRRRGGLS